MLNASHKLLIVHAVAVYLAGVTAVFTLRGGSWVQFFWGTETLSMIVVRLGSALFFGVIYGFLFLPVMFILDRVFVTAADALRQYVGSLGITLIALALGGGFGVFVAAIFEQRWVMTDGGWLYPLSGMLTATVYLLVLKVCGAPVWRA